MLLSVSSGTLSRGGVVCISPCLLARPGGRTPGRGASPTAAGSAKCQAVAGGENMRSSRQWRQRFRGDHAILRQGGNKKARSISRAKPLGGDNERLGACNVHLERARPCPERARSDPGRARFSPERARFPIGAHQLRGSGRSGIVHAALIRIERKERPKNSSSRRLTMNYLGSIT